MWLLVARPIIWIEEEMAERRREGIEPSAKDVWRAGVVADEKPPRFDEGPANR